MSIGFIILIGVGLCVGGFLNIRSLIRKWKHNPDKWVDLLVGVVVTLSAIGLLTWQILVNHVL